MSTATTGRCRSGRKFVSDIVNRTHIAQDQAQCLLAAELSIRAQMTAARVTLA